MTTRPTPLIHGLWCATLTPLARNGGIDHARFAAHVHALLAQGVDGVAPFGTTGEGQSFGADERRAGLEALLAAGIPGSKIVAATGCAALPETIALSRHALAAGCVACLVLPPFFWKDATDDGLFTWYARLIDGVADPRLKLFLYHLPQVSAVPLSVDLVARLATAFPGIVAGIKDSEGNWDHTSALLARVPELTVVIGHEPHLPRLIRAGGAGTICGVANIYPELVRALLAPTVTPDDEKRIAAFIEIAFQQPFLAGFKSMLADRLHDPEWRSVRAPLVALDEAQQRSQRAALERAGFALAAAGASSNDRERTMSTDLQPADLEALADFDTPTICNALERLDPQTQGRGYTTEPFLCGFPLLRPVVGYARTAMIRSAQPLGAAASLQRSMQNDYYRYIDAGVRPSIVVIQDLDGAEAGYGAFWGEVQSAIHVGLGARGLITDGSVRDLDQWAPGFQFLAARVAPSHAYAKPVAFGTEVQVFGLRVRSGDLLHADRHGAVVIPPALARDVPAAAREIAAREARILAVARGPACSAEKLIAVFAELDSIH